MTVLAAICIVSMLPVLLLLECLILASLTSGDADCLDCLVDTLVADSKHGWSWLLPACVCQLACYFPWITVSGDFDKVWGAREP